MLFSIQNIDSKATQNLQTWDIYPRLVTYDWQFINEVIVSERMANFTFIWCLRL